MNILKKKSPYTKKKSGCRTVYFSQSRKDKKKHCPPVFEEGDFVLLKNQAPADGTSWKLKPHFKGPYMVKERVGNRYRVVLSTVQTNISTKVYMQPSTCDDTKLPIAILNLMAWPTIIKKIDKVAFKLNTRDRTAIICYPGWRNLSTILCYMYGLISFALNTPLIPNSTFIKSAHVLKKKNQSLNCDGTSLC